MVERKHVDGRRPADILLYTLTTCGWCKRTKALLQEVGIGYDYIDVDTVDPSELEAVKDELIRWNPAGSFPTVVVNKQSCIIGFDEDKLRRLAGE